MLGAGYGDDMAMAMAVSTVKVEERWVLLLLERNETELGNGPPAIFWSYISLILLR